MPGAAGAHDSLAPPGAPHQWLPPEEWVFRHWIPFDEAELERALSLGPGELESYLYNDHHTLAQLARWRGVDHEQLADRLLASWHGLTPDRLAVLRDRTLRILTQGHLAQHVFFHSFHGVGMQTRTQELFGVSHEVFNALRRLGFSGAEIAQRHGVDPVDTLAGLDALFREDRDAGIESRRAWPLTSDRILARQRRTAGCWLQRPRPARDRGNPFGKATLQHGRHPAGWPSTAQQRILDEWGAERVRRRLTRSCWPRPAPWVWGPGDPGPPTATAAHLVCRLSAHGGAA
jgi:hypothetical protein